MSEEQPVARDDLRSLLLAWQSGEVDERYVHEEAEELDDRIDGQVELPRTDPESIVREIIFQLSLLNRQLIMQADIPEILRFLDTPPGDELNGWTSWCAYWDGLDYTQREEELKGTYYLV